MSDIIRYHETTYNRESKRIEDVCDWSVMQAGNNLVIIQKELPDGTFRKKNIRVVEDYDGNVWKLQKTQIKANGAAAGLMKFFRRCIEEDFMTCDVRRILNYAFDIMKECKA